MSTFLSHRSSASIRPIVASLGILAKSMLGASLVHLFWMILPETSVNEGKEEGPGLYAPAR